MEEENNENLIEKEFKDAVREAILAVCKKHNISEKTITYKVDFSCQCSFNDTIEK